MKPRISFFCAVVLFCFGMYSCNRTDEPVSFSHWTVSEPIFKAGPAGSFDDVAVKDPSLVYFDGMYHMFYTGKFTPETSAVLKEQDIPASPNRAGAGYVSAPSLEELHASERHNFCQIANEIVIAPQVFYFEPHKLWYVVAQRYEVGPPSRLIPIYMTNPDISNVYGWSKPKDLRYERPNGGFWIDFWVICDDRHAHLFFSDQEGQVLRMQCPLDEFPEGIATATEEVAYSAEGEDQYGEWKMFEAQHIYFVKETGQYFAMGEAAYWQENLQRYFDARNRFMIGLVADRLEGPWELINTLETTHFAHIAHLYNEDGSRSRYTQVSHPELIRSGYNQNLEIDDFRFTMLFQSFDGSVIPDNYNYHDLPWEISIMRNH